MTGPTGTEDLLRRYVPQVLGAPVRRYGHFDTAAVGRRHNRRRAPRRSLTAVAVVAGGGLTLWLQDSVRPQEPYGWEKGDGATPRNAYGSTSGGDGVGCPPSPEPEPIQGRVGRPSPACT
ncbi:hypothetical protein [Streptomyces sp. NPDC017958]|uniref:hypothetical protein n=1 Tax=Streptomyces sp. NPDC017958 TaxID=3365021 RepID=UPI0037A36E55